MQPKHTSDETGSNGQADGMPESPTEGAQRSASALPTEIRDFVTDVGDLITATSSLTGADLSRARAKIVERASAAKASLLKMGSAVGDQARQGVRATDDYVHEQPWQALGIGALLGLALGIVIARRRE